MAKVDLEVLRRVSRNVGEVGNGSMIIESEYIELAADEIAALRSDLEATEDCRDRTDIMCGGLVVKNRALRDELDLITHRLSAAELDFEQMLRVMPVAICKKFCKNASPHCAGWCECEPVWRGTKESV